MARSPSALLMALIWLGGFPGPAPAQEDDEGYAPAAEQIATDDGAPAAPRFDWGVEVKTHFRSSDAVTVRTPGDAGAGQSILLETVDPGEHFEVSAVSLFVDARWSETVQARLKVDVIDLYERNPTSTDREVDVDEAWIRFGRATEPGELPEGRGAYVKIGKFAHFERQEDRQLESYGLSTTAFNRLEDVGVELGLDLHRNFYLKASVTRGNPVFFRDVNALAGDTGATLLTPENAELGSGLGILYDAEVEDLGGDGDVELGLGLGLRFGDDHGQRNLDVLFWGYQRDLQESVDLEGSELGGDLAILRGLGGGEPLPISGDEKREWGLNVWYYDGPFAFFGQYVDQELAGLPRRGFEAELSWFFELPLIWGDGERQILSSVTPVLRYSRLLADYEHPSSTPLPSRAWDWYKVDVGARVQILDGLDVTTEYTFNHGYLTDINEFLTTLRWRR